MLPVFPVRLLLLIIPVALAAVMLGFGGARGGGFLKKQGVAWAVTIVMVIAAIGIGYAKSPANAPKPEYMPTPTHAPAASTYPPASSSGDFVWDNARVLSDRTEKALNERNDRLWRNHQVSIGVVTCNYGGDDLYSYAVQCAGDMGLGGYDMIVALDISGDNYWLVQGNDIRRAFTDADCSDYAYDYMEDFFARGMYDDAVLALTEALEAWYGIYYF